MNTFDILVIFVAISTLGIHHSGAPDNPDTPRQSRDDIEAKRSEKSLEQFTKLAGHFTKISNRTEIIKTFGPLAEEFVMLRNQGNGMIENTTEDKELKRLYSYFFATTTMEISPKHIFANFYLTHFAKWMKLNYQVCATFYKNVQQNENKALNCQRLSEYLNLFASTLSDLKDQQFNNFKNNFVKILKEKLEGEVKIDPYRLKAFTTPEVPALDYEKCEQPVVEGQPTQPLKKKYCETWIDLLKIQPKDFILNQVFFNAYFNVKAQEQFKFEVYDFLYAFGINEKLWENAGELLKITDGSSQGEKSESSSIEILGKIMKFKKKYVEERRKKTSQR